MNKKLTLDQMRLQQQSTKRFAVMIEETDAGKQYVVFDNVMQIVVASSETIDAGAADKLAAYMNKWPNSFPTPTVSRFEQIISTGRISSNKSFSEEVDRPLKQKP